MGSCCGSLLDMLSRALIPPTRRLCSRECSLPILLHCLGLSASLIFFSSILYLHP